APGGVPGRAAPPGGAAPRRAPGEPRPGRRGADRAPDRAPRASDPRAHQPRSESGAGRGGPGPRAEGRPSRLRHRAGTRHRRPAQGALRVRAASTILRKDLTLELRTLEVVPAMVLFSVATFVIFHFALNRAVIAVPAFALLLLGPSIGPPLGGLVVLLLLADIALAVIGTLVSAIAIHTRARDLIAPIIGLPLLIPALIATARGAGPLLATHGSGFPQGKWLAILALYDLVFALLSYAVFDFLLED